MAERTCSYLDRRRRERCTECGTMILQCICQDPDDKAINRLETDHGKTLTAIWGEVWVRKPGQLHLYEEAVKRLGDIGQLLIQHNESRSPAPDVIHQELIRLGALIVVLATEGTDEYAYPAG